MLYSAMMLAFTFCQLVGVLPTAESTFRNHVLCILCFVYNFFDRYALATTLSRCIHINCADPLRNTLCTVSGNTFKTAIQTVSFSSNSELIFKKSNFFLHVFSGYFDSADPLRHSKTSPDPCKLLEWPSAVRTGNLLRRPPRSRWKQILLRGRLQRRSRRSLRPQAALLGFSRRKMRLALQQGWPRHRRHQLQSTMELCKVYRSWRPT